MQKSPRNIGLKERFVGFTILIKSKLNANIFNYNSRRFTFKCKIEILISHVNQKYFYNVHEYFFNFFFFFFLFCNNGEKGELRIHTH